MIVNKHKQILCVVQHDKKTDDAHLNLPMGKMDHKDDGDVKQTAFREQLEETGVKLTEEEIKNASGPFEVALPLTNFKSGKKTTKSVYFYMVENFEKDRVDINYTSKEGKGLLWVDPDKFQPDEEYDIWPFFGDVTLVAARPPLSEKILPNWLIFVEDHFCD